MTPSKQTEAPTLSTRMRIEWPLVVTLILAAASYTKLSVQMDALITAVNKLVVDVGAHESRLTRIEAQR